MQQLEGQLDELGVILGSELLGQSDHEVILGQFAEVHVAGHLRQVHHRRERQDPTDRHGPGVTLITEQVHS